MMFFNISECAFCSDAIRQDETLERLEKISREQDIKLKELAIDRLIIEVKMIIMTPFYEKFKEVLLR